MSSPPSSVRTEPLVRSMSTSLKTPSPPGPSRQTRIHFPSETESPPSKAPGSLSLTATRSRPLGANSHQHALPTPAASLDDDLHERRRVQSASYSDSLRPLGSYSRSQYLAAPSHTRSSGKRAVSYSLHNSDQSYTKGTSSIGSSPLSGGVLLLSEQEHVDKGDDPNILADLHKALQYKPHVEQHLKDAKSLADVPNPSLPSPSKSTSNASATPLTAKIQLPYSEPNTPIKAEFIDFSPSTGISALHPVPTSSDDGATLDWSGSTTDEEKHERKWTMSLPRRSSKEKNQPLSRKALVEKQEAQYSDKLARISGKANELTIRKAEITKDQLQRRYATLDASYIQRGTNLNLAEVARWYDKQEDAVKSLILENEPMPWVTHLLRKDRYTHQDQRSPSPWNLSAMIVDEYVRSKSDAEFFLSPNSSGGDIASDAGSLYAAKLRQVSKPTSFRSLDAVSARKSDEMVSFEPMVRSQRDSGGTDSRVSVDAQLKRWRQSLLNRADGDISSESSIRSRNRTRSIEQGNAHSGWNSPAVALSPLHGLGIKKRSQATPALLNSDDGQSSAVDSMVERLNESRVSEEKASKTSSHEKKRSRFRLSMDVKSQSQDDSKPTLEPLSIAELRTDANQRNKTQSLPADKKRRAAESTETFDRFPSSSNRLGSPININSARNSNQKKSQRLSLPPTFQTPRARRGRSNTRTEAQNHALQVEYSRKKDLLDAVLARNQRMKSLQQVAARTITDYDEIQSILSKKLGLSYSRLPPDVLEALKHDPSVSMGHLRNLRGWRAVEDIYLRRETQKEVLQSFVASLDESVTPLSLPKEGIYENAISNLTDLVERLHNQRGTVLSHVRQAHELLSRVKKMRDELKPEYDETSKYTSANYPELVRLESLLDELVNETNHLWKLAEASLSFLLASVAPLMKTFGRPIWDELHDFLVIPLYRNGFSGEDHWYPVSFPRRSFGHWLRLLLFAVCTPIFLSQGSYAFFALLTHGYVLRIPSFVPAFVVYVIFSGVMCFFASLLSGLLVAVLCEVFIVLWWTLWLLHIVR